MRRLHIDIETSGSVSLPDCGVHKYAAAPDFKILLFGYAFDNDEPTSVDLAQGEKLSADVYEALTDTLVLKLAHNAAFEIEGISHFFNIKLDPSQWECTMVKCAVLGYPMALNAVAAILGIPGKLDEGKALIKYFTEPCKATKVNGGRTLNQPADAPEKWVQFIEYNRRDVLIEQKIDNILSFYEISQSERDAWVLDQEISDRGIELDITFIHTVLEMEQMWRQKLLERAKDLTGLENFNSTQQLTRWLEQRGVFVTSLDKESISNLLENHTNDPVVYEALTLRQRLSKTAVKKYQAMLNYAGTDHRARGLLQFYGAGRTGRYAGRGIQVHNLPRIYDKNIDNARRLIANLNSAAIDLIYESPLHLLAELIRTAFVARKGYKLIVSDFSAIEARIVAWLAGDKKRMEIFATHGKIYEASAAAMFKVPFESITKDSPYRQKGKISELALGFGGGVGALTTMEKPVVGYGGDIGELVTMGTRLNPEERQPLVNAWRINNPDICRLWKTVEKAALKALEGYTVTLNNELLSFYCRKGFLFIKLPSGRELSYVGAHTVGNQWGGKTLAYKAMDSVTFKWGAETTYGGKLVENIVQAIARDCLQHKLGQLKDVGDIVMHVHDEIVLEVPENSDLVKTVDEIMCADIPWAPGLLLKSETFESPYYKK